MGISIITCPNKATLYFFIERCRVGLVAHSYCVIESFFPTDIKEYFDKSPLPNVEFAIASTPDLRTLLKDREVPSDSIGIFAHGRLFMIYNDMPVTSEARMEDALLRIEPNYRARKKQRKINTILHYISMCKDTAAKGLDSDDIDIKCPYSVLGIGLDATLDEAKKAYKRLAREYHPDNVSTHAKKFQDLAHREMKNINIAFEMVSKEKSIAS